MSNAEEAWKEYLGEFEGSEDVPVSMLFLAGYARGQRDALVLPEVRAEELEEGKWYRVETNDGATAVGVIVSGVFIGLSSAGLCHMLSTKAITSFRGPLQMGEV